MPTQKPHGQQTASRRPGRLDAHSHHQLYDGTPLMVGDGPGGAVAFTEQKSIGGRIWPNVMFDDEAFDAAFAVWGNSTLGLLSHWWHSNRQQSSKAGMAIRPAESLPVVDFRTLSDAQLYTAHAIFDDFRQLDLQPAYLADADAKDAANGPGRSSTESVSRFYAAHAAHTMISQGVPTHIPTYAVITTMVILTRSQAGGRVSERRVTPCGQPDLHPPTPAPVTTTRA